MKTIQDAKILILDDQETNIRLLKEILSRAGYSNLACSDDSREFLPLYLDSRPDLILLDLHMPHLTGFDVMERLSDFTQDDYVPVLVLTADNNPATKQRALSCGAMDFITKPFNISEVLLRVRNVLQTRQMHLQLKSKNSQLEELVRERTIRLENSQIQMMERLAHVAECHDYETSEHTYRVGCLAANIAQAMGMTEPQISLLRRAAALHDIGKLAVPDSICLKPGRLTPEEFEIMKTHVEAGARLLQDGQCEVIQMAETIALTHHERYDGSGYPYGLKGEDIPLVGRIVALADVFDALLQQRPYKVAWPLQKVYDEILVQSGKHFDPAVVEAFFSLQNSEGGSPVDSLYTPSMKSSDGAKDYGTTTMTLSPTHAISFATKK
ncbi:cyclic di-GMP phosphodiesterase [Abditibacteriota bacterium]|nr:cyclic di-GMP phosphodiesterase [Abditibacteriota bacterium]